MSSRKRNMETSTDMMAKTDMIRNLTRESLQYLLRGELFMKLGLKENALIKLKMQTNEEFQMFMDYIVGQFINSHASGKETSKKEKAKFCLSKKDIVSFEINTFINERNKTTTAVTSNHNNDSSETETYDDHNIASNNPSVKRKKAAIETSPPSPHHPENGMLEEDQQHQVFAMTSTVMAESDDINSFSLLEISLRSSPLSTTPTSTQQQTQQILAYNNIDRHFLYLFTKELRVFQERHFGRNASNTNINEENGLRRWSMMPRIPESIFRDRTRKGPLYIALLSALEYKKQMILVKQQEQSQTTIMIYSWINELAQANKVNDHTLMFQKMYKDLYNHGYIPSYRFYFDKSINNNNVAENELIKLINIALQFGGIIVQHPLEATHIVAFDPEIDSAEERAKEVDYYNENIKDQEFYLRTLSVSEDQTKALVHWWYWPNSVDEWIDSNDVNGVVNEDDNDVDRAENGAFVVSCRLLRDVARFNEWGIEIDYAIMDFEKHIDADIKAAKSNQLKNATTGNDAKEAQNNLHSSATPNILKKEIQLEWSSGISGSVEKKKALVGLGKTVKRRRMNLKRKQLGAIDSSSFSSSDNDNDNTKAIVMDNENIIAATSASETPIINRRTIIYNENDLEMIINDDNHATATTSVAEVHEAQKITSKNDIEDHVQFMMPLVKEAVLLTTTSSNFTAAEETNAIINFLSSIKFNLNNMSSTFLEASGLPDFLKEMKRAFKLSDDSGNSDCLALCKDVLKVMKSNCRKKKNQIEQQKEVNERTAAATAATSSLFDTELSQDKKRNEHGTARMKRKRVETSKNSSLFSPTKSEKRGSSINIPNKHTFREAISEFDKKANYWQAFFTYDKRRYLGSYATRNEADLALESVRSYLNQSKIRDKNTTLKIFFKNTYFDKRCNKWRSYFTYDKSRQIGAFKTREEGVLALDMLRNKLDHSNINDKTSVDAIVKQVYDTITSQNLTIETAKDQSNELHIALVENIVKRVSNKAASDTTSNMSNTVAAKDSTEPISSTSSSQNTTSKAVNEAKIVSSSEASSSPTSNTSNTAMGKNATESKKNDVTGVYETSPASEVRDATESKRYIFKCATTSYDVQTNRWRAYFHYDKTRYLGYFANRKLAFLALEIIRKKLEESIDHTAQSIDEAARITQGILSSLSNGNKHLERVKDVTKTRNNEEGSASTSSSSLPSYATKESTTSTTLSTTALGMNQGNNSSSSLSILVKEENIGSIAIATTDDHRIRHNDLVTSKKSSSRSSSIDLDADDDDDKMTGEELFPKEEEDQEKEDYRHPILPKIRKQLDDSESSGSNLDDMLAIAAEEIGDSNKDNAAEPSTPVVDDDEEEGEDSMEVEKEDALVEKKGHEDETGMEGTESVEERLVTSNVKIEIKYEEQCAALTEEKQTAIEAQIANLVEDRPVATNAELENEDDEEGTVNAGEKQVEIKVEETKGAEETPFVSNDWVIDSAELARRQSEGLNQEALISQIASNFASLKSERDFLKSECENQSNKIRELEATILKLRGCAMPKNS